MRVHVNFYAVLKDYFSSVREYAFTPGQNISDLRLLLKTDVPQSTEILSVCRVAVNNNIVADEYALKVGDVVDVLPPSSGG